MIVQPSDRVARVKTYYFARKLAEVNKLAATGKDVINLGIGSPDLPAPEEVLLALQDASKHPNASQYQSYRGLPELR